MRVVGGGRGEGRGREKGGEEGEEREKEEGEEEGEEGNPLSGAEYLALCSSSTPLSAHLPWPDPLSLLV